MRGQASPEFLVAMMLFLGSSVFVVTSVMRTYFLASGEYHSGFLDLSAEKVGRYLLDDPGEEGWLENPAAAVSAGTDSLSGDRLDALSGMSYPELKRLFGMESDFKVRVEYLPSYVMVVDDRTQYLAGWTNMTLEVYDSSGALVSPANVTAALVGPETVLAVVTERGPSYRLGFYATTPGSYTLRVAAVDEKRYGSYRSRVEVIS